MLLEGDGLVEIEPRRGAVVRTFDPADLVDLYEVRAVLEARAAARTAKDWARSDALRAEIDAAGWIVKDSKEGQKLTRK